MTAIVTLCNAALSRLGRPRIASLQEHNPEARQCQLLYQPTLDYTLTLYPWSFALQERILAALQEDKSLFPLPQDCLRIVSLARLGDQTYDLRPQGVYLKTQRPPRLLYIARVTEVQAMPPWFQETLIAHLVFKLALAFGNVSTTQAQYLRQDYQNTLDQAITIEQQQYPNRGELSWLHARWQNP